MQHLHIKQWRCWDECPYHASVARKNYNTRRFMRNKFHPTKAQLVVVVVVLVLVLVVMVMPVVLLQWWWWWWCSWWWWCLCWLWLQQ